MKQILCLNRSWIDEAIHGLLDTSKVFALEPRMPVHILRIPRSTGLTLHSYTDWVNHVRAICQLWKNKWKCLYSDQQTPDPGPIENGIIKNNTIGPIFPYGTRIVESMGPI